MPIGFVQGGTYQCRGVVDPSFNMALDIGLATIRVRGKNMHRALLRGQRDPTAISSPIEVFNDCRGPPSTKIVHMPRSTLLHEGENSALYIRGKSCLPKL
jgi:hypothetical protein